MVDDHHFMARAVQIAERGLYGTDPNPRVGCVLVRDTNIVGEGWHQRAGEAHAEVNALRAAGELARGATAYVSLEPCCHHGRTPPCTGALIQAGIKRVVVAMHDPNPAVAGRGVSELEAAGVAVTVGVMRGPAERLNPGFIMRMCMGRPYVRCKLAMSLDGRTAMASGESRWITGASARADVQRLRARSSAIVVGVGTVLADDPSLTVRAPECASGSPARVRHPLRVVCDSRLRTPPHARLLRAPGETVIATTLASGPGWDTLARQGATLVTLPACGHGRIDPAALLHYLANRQSNEVLLESGAILCGTFLKANLIDEIVLYIAPLLMGDGARGLFQLPGLEQMSQRIQLRVDEVRALGDDWRITVFPTAA